MNYLALVWTEGLQVPEAIAVMQRDLPRWIDEMDGRGVRLGGRELELPETAASVRVRDGETLVTDGPFAETKEFVAGFDLLDCADLDEAIEVTAKSPVARFHPIEIRPFSLGVRLEGVREFALQDDPAGPLYLLAVWMGGTPAAPLDEEAVALKTDTWRQDLEARGVHILGGGLQGPETATTLTVTDEETLLADGPGGGTREYIAGVDVVRCGDRQQAIELAAAHPMAPYHAIEVRPFWSE